MWPLLGGQCPQRGWEHSSGSAPQHRCLGKAASREFSQMELVWGVDGGGKTLRFSWGKGRKDSRLRTPAFQCRQTWAGTPTLPKGNQRELLTPGPGSGTRNAVHPKGNGPPECCGQAGWRPVLRAVSPPGMDLPSRWAGPRGRDQCLCFGALWTEGCSLSITQQTTGLSFGPKSELWACHCPLPAPAHHTIPE